MLARVLLNLALTTVQPSCQYKHCAEAQQTGIYIEIRGIKEVQPWFLRHVGLGKDKMEDFLVRHDTIVDDALRLFDFLVNFKQLLHDSVLIKKLVDTWK